MGKIRKIEKLTANPYVNLYDLNVENSKGHAGKYYVSSRAKNVEDLELSSKQQSPDGVIIYSLYGEARDKVVLIRQYRYAIDNYIYEFPAGLIEPGEDYHAAAVREMREETGLILHPIVVDTIYEKPYYTTIGMTDECCATVYGYADGTVSADMQETSEEIELFMADRHDELRILREEPEAIV
ncbi:MAG: NUDIX hydrolase [Clostridiales bacterium]|nr:NUDIX hydrolase [Clostridiales bacterium]